MTTNSPERLAFNKYRDVLVRRLGDKALDDATINMVGSKLFAHAWGGVFPVDRVKLQPYHFMIINTDPHDKSGEHWLACFTTNKRAYVYDSYSRPIEKLVPQLVKTIHKAGFTLGKTNKVKNQEQRGHKSEVCGVLSLAWLLIARDLGIELAKNI